MAENLTDLSYVAIKRQSSITGTVIPDVFFNAYSATFETDVHLDLSKPMIGNKFKVFKTFRGMRSHAGEITFHGDPNNMARAYDMLWTKQTVSGAGPYTNIFLATGNSNFYTIEIAKGDIVERFTGCCIYSMNDAYDANIMKPTASFSALKSFTERVVSNVSGTTITLDTNYDAAPTDGLVANDLVQFTTTAGASAANTTVASVTNGTVFEVASGTGITIGDVVSLRPQTVSDTSQTPFLWTKTEYHFDTDAATALTNTQTRVEPGSTWTVMHDLLPTEGAQRSGGFDPENLVRGQTDVQVKVKLAFQLSQIGELQRFMENNKRAIVVRQYGDAVSGTAMEHRLTINDARVVEYTRPLQIGEIIYTDITYAAAYDASDASAFKSTVIHNLTGF